MRVVVVTGARAEYGLLRPLIGALSRDPEFSVRVFATGMHLSPEFGLTYREIERDGFAIAEKIEILLSSDTPTGVSKSMGLAMIGLAEGFDRHTPELVLLLGDRFETFCAAAAACVAGIPVAHIHGGELTLGAIDDAFRHCITKLSQLHFTATEEYRRRVIQMGERPETVHTVGAIGVEAVKSMRLLSREQLEGELGFRFGERNLLVTYHPVTTLTDAGEALGELLAALDSLRDCTIVFTGANADAGGRAINQALRSFVASAKGRAVIFESLGQLRYLSVMSACDAVVGNSSSGIIEAPSLGVPTVNIGERQRGRTRARSVVDCGPDRRSIAEAIQKVLSGEFRALAKNAANPYDGGPTVETIMHILKTRPPRGRQKQFFDIGMENGC